MQFYQVKKRSPILPIIPLIDILAILLIFFSVTTQFKNKRKLFEVELPEVKGLQTRVGQGAYSLLVLNSSGEISLDGLKIGAEYLTESLKNFRKKYPLRQLELEADQRASIEDLFHLWDSFVSAGLPIREVPTRVRFEKK